MNSLLSNKMKRGDHMWKWIKRLIGLTFLLVIVLAIFLIPAKASTQEQFKKCNSEYFAGRSGSRRSFYCRRDCFWPTNSSFN